MDDEVLELLVDDTTANDAPVDGSSAGGSLTVEDVRHVVDDALDSRGVGDDTGVIDRVDGLYEEVGAVRDTQEDILAAVSAVNEDSEQGSTIVLVDSDQWEEVRECWLYAKEYGSVATVCVVLQLALLAAIFGSRIYATFSEGWRSRA